MAEDNTFRVEHRGPGGWEKHEPFGPQEFPSPQVAAYARQIRAQMEHIAHRDLRIVCNTCEQSIPSDATEHTCSVVKKFAAQATALWVKNSPACFTCGQRRAQHTGSLEAYPGGDGTYRAPPAASASAVWRATQRAQKARAVEENRGKGSIYHHNAALIEAAMEALCRDVWGRLPEPGDPAEGPGAPPIRDRVVYVPSRLIGYRIETSSSHVERWTPAGITFDDLEKALDYRGGDPEERVVCNGCDRVIAQPSEDPDPIAILRGTKPGRPTHECPGLAQRAEPYAYHLQWQSNPDDDWSGSVLSEEIYATKDEAREAMPSGDHAYRIVPLYAGTPEPIE